MTDCARSDACCFATLGNICCADGDLARRPFPFGCHPPDGRRSDSWALVTRQPTHCVCSCCCSTDSPAVATVVPSLVRPELAGDGADDGADGKRLRSTECFGTLRWTLVVALMQPTTTRQCPG